MVGMMRTWAPGQPWNVELVGWSGAGVLHITFDGGTPKGVGFAFRLLPRWSLCELECMEIFGLLLSFCFLQRVGARCLLGLAPFQCLTLPRWLGVLHGCRSIFFFGSCVDRNMAVATNRDGEVASGSFKHGPQTPGNGRRRNLHSLKGGRLHWPSFGVFQFSPSSLFKFLARLRARLPARIPSCLEPRWPRFRATRLGLSPQFPALL